MSLPPTSINAWAVPTFKGDKLQELKDLLRHLKSQSGLFNEGADKNIQEGKLSKGMTWEYPGLVSKIDNVLQDIQAEIGQNNTALQAVKPGSDANSSGTSGVSGGSGSGVFPCEPFNGMQITYNINGASITGSTDSPGFTTSRTIIGSLEAGQLHISGSAKMGGGYGADLNVRVNVDIDNNVALVNLAHVKLDVPARLEGGRTLVPLRFIAETFGLKVNWDSVRNEINIRS